MDAIFQRTECINLITFTVLRPPSSGFSCPKVPALSAETSSPYSLEVPSQQGYSSAGNPFIEMLPKASRTPEIPVAL